MSNCLNTNDLGLLDDIFIIKDILGEGGYSTVYKVTKKETNEEYAAKIIEKFCKNEFKINQIFFKNSKFSFYQITFIFSM